MTEDKPVGIRIGQIFLKEVQFAHRPDAFSIAPNTPHPPGEVEVQLQFYGTPASSTAAVGVVIRTPEGDTTSLYR